MLMRWAEQTSESIMLREVPSLAGVDKCSMLLRVSLRHPLLLMYPLSYANRCLLFTSSREDATGLTAATAVHF